MAQNARKKLIIDCDPGLGIRWADVDDSLAILLALASPEIEVMGLSITYGNVDLATGIQVAEATAKAAKIDLPVIPGAANAADTQDNPAASWLVDQVTQQPGEITLLALGPLTNLSAALDLDNRFLHKLEHLVIMGGAVKFPFFGWRGEHNFRHDPLAVSRIFSSGILSTLITMDVCRSAQLTEVEHNRFSQMNTPLSDFIADGTRHWLTLHQRLLRLRGFYPWDIVAVAAIIKPELFTFREENLHIRTRGIRRGSLQQTPSGHPVHLATRLEGNQFMTLFMDRMTALCQQAK